MTRSQLLAHRLRLALALVLAVAVPACTLSNGTKNGGTTTRPPGGGQPSGGSCGGNQQFQLTGAGSMDDPCAFDPVVVRNSHCQLLRIDAEAAGAAQVPPGVIFEKDGAAFDRSANVASVGTWSATTTNFNCSNGPGCADGTYALRLSQPENPILCSEFGSVTLKLVLR
jgi:hypothetical protein